MIRAVLFDLDGVLVDTLHYHYLAWRHMFELRGGRINKDTVLSNEGRSSRETLPLLMRESGVFIPDTEQSAFLEAKQTYFRSILKVRWYTHAMRVIEVLKERGFLLALVTGSARLNMARLLNAAEQSLFDFIITGEDVRHAKPHPAPYLEAATHLQLLPEECVVVENAPLGIQAAKAAGMYCIAVETTLGRAHLRAADCILDNIRAVPEHPLLCPQPAAPIF